MPNNFLSLSTEASKAPLKITRASDMSVATDLPRTHNQPSLDSNDWEANLAAFFAI
jgi:hypothetical protein